MLALRKICLSFVFLLITASFLASSQLSFFIEKYLYIPSFFTNSAPTSTQLLETLYGTDVTPAPLILETINHKSMQRLQHIDQAGPTRYHTKVAPYSRYTHSLGVYYLLKRFGASEKEQLAGLLHDASHTAFSHLADHIFYGQERGNSSFQDDIHTWHLSKMGLGEVMDKHNIVLQDIDPHSGSFPYLEADYPDVCADRLDSNLQTGFHNGVLTKQDIRFILDNLRHENGQWYFVDAQAAKKLAETSLLLTENYWASPQNMVIYEWYAQAIRHAMDRGLLTKNEIIFGKDADVITVLKESADPYIQQRLQWCELAENHYKVVTKKGASFDKKYTPKFRGMDPLVKKSNGDFSRLSALDPAYKRQYEGLKEKMRRGLKIKFLA